MERYETVWPLSVQRQQSRTTVTSNEDMNQARIAFVWDNLFYGDRMFELIRGELSRRWPQASFVGHEEFPDIHGTDFDETGGTDQLLSALSKHEATGVVVAVGACGSCTPVVLRAAAAIESSGIPAVAICGEAFGPMAAVIAEAEGFPDLPTVLYPGPGLIMTDSAELFRQKVLNDVLPQVTAGLQRTA